MKHASLTFGAVRIISLLLVLLSLSACSVRRLPPYEKPLRRTGIQKVRMTAYTHSERDHKRYGSKTALGTPLRTGAINSVAADWARWPAHTRFRILETGQICEVDDYGWALAGTNTIDFYCPSHKAMNRWGTRRVNIEILHWGDPWYSYKRLKPVQKHKHVKRMMKEIKSFY